MINGTKLSMVKWEDGTSMLVKELSEMENSINYTTKNLGPLMIIFKPVN